MEIPLLENHLRQFYRLLGHTGRWTQVHAQENKANKLVSRELLYGEEAIVKWAYTFNGVGNLYLGRAPRDEAGKVACLNAFSVDVDPVRPKDTASSDAAHSESLSVGRAICARYGGSYLCSSGNGALVFWSFERSLAGNLRLLTEKCRVFEEQIRNEFQTAGVKIDATYDAARLCRAVGTLNTKGEQVGQRLSRFIVPNIFRGVGPTVCDRIEQIPVSEDRERSRTTVAYPEMPSDLFKSRSEADYVLASKCVMAGFGPEATLAALREYSFRPERRDDHVRLVQKLYSKESVPVNGADNLWTPGEGLTAIQRSDGCGGAISTGFKWLDDRLNGGYRPGVCYQVAGITNAGKTTFLIQTANRVCESGKRVLLVTTEANIEETVQRYTAVGTGISASKLITGRLTESDEQRLGVYNNTFRTHAFAVRYTTSPNTKAVEADINSFKPDIVLWDYFQHFETTDGSRQTQLGALARWFESAAIQFNIPIVVGSQLHTTVDFKTGKQHRASMQLVKDCKVINDVSKVVLVLDWDHREATNEDGPVNVRWSLDKNKGPMGETRLLLHRSIPKFEEI